MEYLINILIALGALAILAILIGIAVALLHHEDVEETSAEPSKEAQEEKTARLAAYVKEFSQEENEEKFTYVGAGDCAIGAALAGGAKVGGSACLGLGSCVHVCPAGAISIENNLCNIAAEQCTACGECIKVCPRGIIELKEYEEAEEE